MEKLILDSVRSFSSNDLHDYFKVIITYHYEYNDGNRAHTVHYAVRTSEVSSFMDSIYDTFSNDAVIQFNGIFRARSDKFWFRLV